MRMNPEHLKTNKKLTLYVSDKFIPYVEEAAKLAEKENKSLSGFLWETLVMRLNETSFRTKNLKGVLADYAVSGNTSEEIREKVKAEVAKDAAKKGSSDRY